MDISEGVLTWFNLIIHQRISAARALRLVTDAENGGTLVLKLGDEILKVNDDDLRALNGLLNLVAAENSHTGLKTNIFYQIFECLNRCEEYQSSETDMHDRFPATASRAYKTTALDRPVVDECFQIIRQVIARQWPRLKLIQTTSSVIVSCDVDTPYEAYIKSFPKLLCRLGGDALKRRSVSGVRKTAWNYYKTLQKDYSLDPNSTFDWMMDVNEKSGNKIAFYFLVDQLVPHYDGHYSIDEPRIRKLMRRIYERGHEIGLHASYGTYKNPLQIKKEVDKLRQVMDAEGIQQNELGSRQHYLRWATPETARYLEAAGVSYDTTLGYADCAGFRCGTCHEYPMFDFDEIKPLKIRQRPLIVMEGSVIHEQYMGLGYSDEALTYMNELKDKCYRVGGSFTLLWHNSHFRNEKDRIFYQELIT